MEINKHEERTVFDGRRSRWQSKRVWSSHISWLGICWVRQKDWGNLGFAHEECLPAGLPLRRDREKSA